MKIGMVTDSLSHLPFEAMLDTAAAVGIEGVGFNACNWTAALTSGLEKGSLTDIPARAWRYITLGYGHDESWWRHFCCRLRMAGYDSWLSIEHEDVLLSRLEGLGKTVALLNSVAPRGAGDFRLQDI
jgi:sugar phosphate isomerase/epimerase